MAHTYDIAAMGNAIVDVLAPASDDFLEVHRIPRGVMTLIDEARAGELYAALPDDRREVAGGSAANTMAGVASFGGKGLYIGKVGNDRLGQSFADGMNALGLKFSTPFAEDGPSTACCVIAVAPDGQRSMNTYLGACRGLGPADIREEDITAAKILYIEGYLWDMEEAKAASRKAIAIARNHGVKVAFTLSDPFCVGRFRGEFLDLLNNGVGIVFANEDEAKALYEAPDFESAAKKLAAWGGIAAVTLSEKGCAVIGRGETHAVPAVKVEQVIDTTGAGDQFAAGFLFGLSCDMDLNTCGRLGVLAASEIIAHYGARPETSLADLAINAGII
jgi:sugar/nucleoside kinase (ribokinase family)